MDCVLQLDKGLLEQFTWLRDWVLFSFFTDLPPMRPQNAVLEIMDTIKPSGSRMRNGVLFHERTTRLQLVTYKNSQYVGEKLVLVPSSLDRKLRAYAKTIRPIFGMHLC